MTPEQMKSAQAFDEALAAYQVVRVHWGYGSGFRATGIGEIVAVYDRSVRVRLLHDVAEPGNAAKIGWPTGFVLKQIPRFRAFDRWQPCQHCVEAVQQRRDQARSVAVSQSDWSNSRRLR